MSISRSHSGLTGRRFLLAFVSLAFAGFGLVAKAQTAPQLLPYTVKLIAGSGTATIAAGGTCPNSGLKSLDAYGDGCLATEIQLTTLGAHIYYGEFPGDAIADSTGAIFFSDGYNGLVRRIDPVTGIVTAIAGGSSATPGVGSSCGAYTSSDANGDGCLSTAVKLNNPAALAFDAAGNLYVADVGKANIRKIAATGGVITTGGIISNVAGGSTYGYNVNNTAGGPVSAATQSYLDEPFGLAFDSAGNLYVADEGEQAIEVINLTGANETLQGVTIPAGTIEKIMGWGSGAAKSSSADCPSFTSTSARGGCYFGLFSDGAQAITSPVDSAYQLAVVPATLKAPNAGYVYVANEFPDDVLQINSSNIVNNYAGILSSAAVTQKRGLAGSYAIGSPFGVAADSYGNVYITDASSGEIWRVDQGSKAMYVVAGGASSVCSAHTDANGDGCPALQAKFGSSAGSSGFAGSVPPAPGIFGISVDAYGDLLVGDTETSLIREVASGSQFGKVGVSPVTQTLEVHFAAGDGPASAAYSIISGGSNFSIVANPAPTCTTNSDTTVDCVLQITAAPTGVTTGSTFAGTLQAVSKLGATGTFPLSGIYFGTPATTTSVVVTVSCAGNTIYLPTTPVTITATIGSSGTPGGTVTFFANGTQIGTPQAVSNGTATLTYTSAAVGTYKITANYSGDSYFTASSGQSGNSIYSENPNFSMSTASYPAASVYPGGTALFSFNLVQNVYVGTIAFSVSGLPPNGTYSMSPSGSISSTGCSTGNTITLSILTQQGAAVLPASFGSFGRGWWSILTTLSGFGLALLIGLRRRRTALRYGRIWMALAFLVAASGMVACSNVSTPAGTPAGTYTVTVTATGSTGATSTLTLPVFTVN